MSAAYADEGVTELSLYEVVEEVESRESDRDMATEVMAGVMLEAGEVKNILSVFRG